MWWAPSRNSRRNLCLFKKRFRYFLALSLATGEKTPAWLLAALFSALMFLLAALIYFLKLSPSANYCLRLSSLFVLALSIVILSLLGVKASSW